MEPPPLSGHAPSQSLVPMEEGNGRTFSAAAGDDKKEQQQHQSGPRPWAGLTRVVTPTAAAELEAVARAVETGQRRLEAADGLIDGLNC